MFSTGDLGYIISALITGCFGLLITWQNRRLHREVKTNHGVRAGARLEQLGDDVAQIKRTMVTQQDLADHAEHDKEIAAQLFKRTDDNREIIIAILGGKNKNA